MYQDPFIISQTDCNMDIQTTFTNMWLTGEESSADCEVNRWYDDIDLH